ncbi:MAG TPA: threonylcarbamoyl-AMP synthase [Candidatus Corynebacterium gallistercoris]|uniref:L-threonylcarbamoyladenylate synthase n=1 Tax=Candidatus Corynebacterium gallistercoris TaxID=2838530 RepID=A0A9D1RYN1_9CORY|nr:threonylcarbamoyl-AMP synthase [Candidatus Corynebacterium gallistercoris]
MPNRVDATDPQHREHALESAANAVKAGRLVVMPTDTVYGIGCDAFDNQAVEALLRAKGRGPDMPVPVLVGSWTTIEGLVREYTYNMRRLVEAFWPGGLSLVVNQAPSLPWNLGDTRGTVMLRMPLHPVAIDLLQRTGPMAVSSANKSGQPPATNVQMAEDQLGAEVNTYIDGGEATMGVPSTIVDLAGGKPRILREGALSAEKIGEVLGISAAELRGEV